MVLVPYVHRSTDFMYHTWYIVSCRYFIAPFKGPLIRENGTSIRDLKFVPPFFPASENKGTVPTLIG